MSKEILERFLLMYPSEVLRTFAELPGAIVHRDFVYVPGSRPDRILLVAHADTVSNKPPDYLEWSGNLLRGDWKYVSTPVATAQPKGTTTTKSQGAIVETTSTTAVTVIDTAKSSLADAIQRCKPEAVTEPLTGLNSDDPPHPFADGKPPEAKKPEGRSILDDIRADMPFEQIAAKYSIPIKTVELVLASITKPAPATAPKLTPVTPPVTRYVDDDWSMYSRYGYDKCLGADDRAGIALLWLMRRSGHSLLITDHEEIGGEGAIAAVKEIGFELAEHQFAMQIDRRYDQEMVFYSCSTKKFEKYMQKATRGYSIGQGSFTDISIICPAVGICGVNLSAGYWNEHSREEMLSYDAWKRTHDVVHRMLWRESHPRFVLPPAPKRKAKGKNGMVQADADWWEREMGIDPYTRAWDRGYGFPEEPERVSTYVPDEEVVAYQVGTMVFCREECHDYVSIAQTDNPQAELVKLRQQDIAEWDVCETCGKKLWETWDLALEGSPAAAEEEPLEANAPMIHLTGERSRYLHT
jgi:hypothetical protein